MNKVKKLDKFYLYMLGLILMLSMLVVFTLRGIIGAITEARALDPELLEASTPRLESAQLMKAFEFITNTNPERLDLRQ